MSGSRVSLLVLAAFLLTFSSLAFAQCEGIENCQLVWADEFDGTEVDTSKWNFQRGDGTEVGLPAGWGNAELQWYTEDNATVNDGMLTITASKESVGVGFQYRSARLRSRFKGDFKYGRIEMRAKMPLGKGLWPAFWMMPSFDVYGGWAASGEIDIMEYLGDKPDEVFGTIHYGAEWPGNRYTGNPYFLTSGSFHDDFHEFAIEWEEGEIRWYVDGNHFATQTEWSTVNGDYPAPFDQEFHLLLNMAVGGYLPGAPDSSTVFPQQYVIDYVRVYQEGEPQVVDPSAMTVDGSMSGTWYNINQSGHGLSIEVLDATTAVVYWYVYDPDGSPIFLISLLTIEADGATGPTWIYSGMKFGEFNPDSNNQVDWGTLTLQFHDCGNLTMDYNSDDAAYGSGSIEMTRLAAVDGRKCVDSPFHGNFHLSGSGESTGSVGVGTAIISDSGSLAYMTRGADFGEVGIGSWTTDGADGINTSVTAFPLFSGAPADFQGSAVAGYNGFQGDFSAGALTGTRLQAFQHNLSLASMAGDYEIFDHQDSAIGSLTIEGTGQASGSTTDGCQYSGTLAVPNTQFNQASVNLDASACGPAVALSGLAAWRPDDGAIEVIASDSANGHYWVLKPAASAASVD